MNKVVEKMWGKLWESLWGKCGKVLMELWKREICTIFGDDLHVFGIVGERFADSFAHVILSVGGWFCTFSTESITTTTNF